jgi:ATP-dependent exoDNAse (exonuclease V) beta subunit
VRLAGDFLSQRGPAGDTPRAEIRLFYVAMTRARETLSVDPDLLEAFTHPHTAALKRQHAAADTQANPQVSQPPRNRARETLSRIMNRAAQHQNPRPDQS